MAAAKNIILAGVKRVVLHDPEDVRISDLGANFYLSETDVGRNRADACLDKLRELNTAVAVEPITGALSNADLTAVDVRACVNRVML
jgi:ubiquitin-activating enzyme E1